VRVFERMFAKGVGTNRFLIPPREDVVIRCENKNRMWMEISEDGRGCFVLKTAGRMIIRPDASYNKLRIEIDL